eukprot:TRINITY_DN761_c0_g1_i1.p1 TRINITY_DN761_c0_g1~~TRINITY_DN761_c0_g1_i1.p1  ORF type:complete len:225 (+),score=80.25 TRINITY_DN761_c0_g1_i1:608-1282(+)
MDWDDEEFAPPVPGVSVVKPNSVWDDKDKEDDDVKESWEDDEPPKPAAPAAAAVPEKVVGKKGMADKKGKEPVKATGVNLDPIAEKLRQQRLVEEADLRVSKDLFKQSGEEEKSLDDFVPKSEEEFKEYAALVAAKLTPFDKSFHYLTMLKAIMRLATVSLKAADTKDLGAALSVITNEKVKAEKDSAAKKKAGPKKKQLHIEKADDDDYRHGGYVDNDDYDFM